MDTDDDLVYWALIRWANHIETGDPLLGICQLRQQLRDPATVRSGRGQWLKQALRSYERLSPAQQLQIGRLRVLAAKVELKLVKLTGQL